MNGYILCHLFIPLSFLLLQKQIHLSGFSLTPCLLLYMFVKCICSELLQKSWICCTIPLLYCFGFSYVLLNWHCFSSFNIFALVSHRSLPIFLPNIPYRGFQMEKISFAACMLNISISARVWKQYHSIVHCCVCNCFISFGQRRNTRTRQRERLQPILL